MEENQTPTESAKHVEPIVKHLKADNPTVQDSVRWQFSRIWDLEEADNLTPEEQRILIVALFIYCAHLQLENANIKLDMAREAIIQALKKWMTPELEEAMKFEKASDDPFKKYVESESERFDKFYEWDYFLPETLKKSDKEWTVKMQKCYFCEFFVRFGRTDFMQTACLFDQIGAKEREEYVNLKLTNLFPKWGSSCTFQFSPKS